jgi:CBS domain containing-hemolysin-like protein
MVNVMDICVATLVIGALAVTSISLILARVIPDEYDRRRPARVVARIRPPMG